MKKIIGLIFCCFLVKCGYDYMKVEKISEETMSLSLNDKSGTKYTLLVKGMSDFNQKFDDFGTEECSDLYKSALVQKAAEEDEDLPIEIKERIRDVFFNQIRDFIINNDEKTKERVLGSGVDLSPKSAVKIIERKCKNGKKIMNISSFTKNLKLGEAGLFLEYMKNKEKN